MFHKRSGSLSYGLSWHTCWGFERKTPIQVWKTTLKSAFWVAAINETIRRFIISILALLSCLSPRNMTLNYYVRKYLLCLLVNTELPGNSSSCTKQSIVHEFAREFERAQLCTCGDMIGWCICTEYKGNIYHNAVWQEILSNTKKHERLSIGPSRTDQT